MFAENLYFDKQKAGNINGGGGGANPKKDEKRLCQFWDFIRGDRLFLT